MAEFNLSEKINEQEIVTNPDHPNCYICNNGLCHLDITMKEVKKQWNKN